MSSKINNQDRFWACTQPMRDVVTKQHQISLAGRKPKISPDNVRLQPYLPGAEEFTKPCI